MMNVQNSALHPIFMANHKYYKVDYANKLTKKFNLDVLNGQSLKGNHAYDRFLFFAGDSLVTSKSSLFD